MPQAATQEKAKERSDRFVVSMSAETAEAVDRLIEEAASKSREVIGVSVRPTRAQIVQSLVTDALDARNGKDKPDETKG